MNTNNLAIITLMIVVLSMTIAMCLAMMIGEDITPILFVINTIVSGLLGFVARDLIADKSVEKSDINVNSPNETEQENKII